MKITGGPNLNGWLVIGFVVLLSIAKMSFTPILIFLGVCIILIPVCIALQYYDRKAGGEDA
jgi:hypothetical protein